MSSELMSNPSTSKIQALTEPGIVSDAAPTEPILYISKENSKRLAKCLGLTVIFNAQRQKGLWPECGEGQATVLPCRPERVGAWFSSVQLHSTRLSYLATLLAPLVGSIEASKIHYFLEIARDDSTRSAQVTRKLISSERRGWAAYEFTSLFMILVWLFILW